MILLLPVLHVMMVYLVVLCWKADSRYRIVFTPFVVYMLTDIVFSWNIWLLATETDVAVSGYAILVSLAATCSFCMGFLFCSKLVRDLCRFPRSCHQLDHYLGTPLRAGRNGFVYEVVVVAVAIIGIALGTIYYNGFPPTVRAMAKMVIAQEISEEVQQIVTKGRRELTKGHFFGGEYRGQGVAKSFMVTAWEYALAIAMIMVVVNRHIRWRMMAIVLFVGTFYYVAGTGERSKFVWALLTGLIALSFVVKVKVRSLLLVAVIAVNFLLLMTVLLHRYEAPQADKGLLVRVADSIVRRVVTGNKINNVRILNWLDDGTLRHTYGNSHLTDLLNVIPGVQVLPLAHRIGEMVDPGKTTYYSGTYLGTVYIDFGPAGVLLIYFVLGIVVKMVFYFILKLPKKIENISFQSLVILHLGKMSMVSGLISFLVGIIPVLVIHCMVKGIIHLLSIGRVAPLPQTDVV